MLTTVKGICRDGRVELDEVPHGAEGARVLVTFLAGPVEVNLQEQGISEEQAAELAWKLRSIKEDWDRPEMAVYDAL